MLVFLMCPLSLLEFFLQSLPVDEALQQLIGSFFAINAVFLLIDGVRNILSGLLRGMQDFKAAMCVGLIASWLVALPMSYVVAFVLHGGAIGLRLGFLSGFLLNVGLLLVRLSHKLNELSVINHSSPDHYPSESLISAGG
jgi:MATE family multidrug resistance protein